MPKNTYVPVRQDERKMRYIEWLTTVPDYRVPRTERELARELDVFPKTLYNWRQDHEFKEVWGSEAEDIVGAPDRRHAVLEVLYRAATDERNPRHVHAAKLYFEATGAIQPPKMEVTVGAKALSMLTQDEIDEMIAAQVVKMRGESHGAGPDGIPAENHTG